MVRRRTRMNRTLLACFATALILPSCSGNVPNISVVCEENSVGNCIIKWETTPYIEGKVKIYSSTDPERIKEKKPVAIADISDQKVTIVTDDPSKRYYYRMVFNNRYAVKTATRNINIPFIYNFRDAGGYPATKSKQLRWGMLYRAAQIDTLPGPTRHELKNIGIKTIVDLRSVSEVYEHSLLDDKDFNVVHIPIGMSNMRETVQAIRDGKILNDSVYRLMKQTNRDFVTYYRPEYRKVFDVLLNENNYPVVIHCSSGKGRTGIASALIFSALGVNDDNIMYDYRLSNEYYNIPEVYSFAYKLSSAKQEAITTLFSARDAFLNAAKDQIVTNYGSIDAYLERGIGLTKEEIKKLRDIMLE